MSNHYPPQNNNQPGFYHYQPPFYHESAQPGQPTPLYPGQFGFPPYQKALEEHFSARLCFTALYENNQKFTISGVYP